MKFLDRTLVGMDRYIAYYECSMCVLQPGKSNVLNWVDISYKPYIDEHYNSYHQFVDSRMRV